MNKTMLSKMIIIICLLCIVIIPVLYRSNLPQEYNFEQNVFGKYSSPFKNQVTQSNSLFSDQNIIVISIYIGFLITIFLVVKNYKYLKQITDKIQILHERIGNLMLELPFMYNEEENKSQYKGGKVSKSDKEQKIKFENKIDEQINSIFSVEKQHSFYRPLPEIIPIPDKFISRLISRTNEIPDIIHKPHISSKSWSSSANTIKGNVRKENQDYAICFDINDHQVSILADGVGGLPGGQRAAYNAVRASAISIVQSLGRNNQFFTKGLDTLALDCIKAASYQLAMEGDRFNIGHKGLRTTLIVVIAGKENIGYAHIGDGGGCIVLESGDIFHFIKPQKAEGMALNVISASLGPTIHGNPINGILERPKGSFVIAGTDGVFDRLEPKLDSFPIGTNEFINKILAGAYNLSGNFNQLISRILHELEEYKDESGYIFNDNLSISIMGNSKKPNINSPLWKNIIVSKALENKPENDSEDNDQDKTECKSDHQ